MRVLFVFDLFHRWEILRVLCPMGSLLGVTSFFCTPYNGAGEDPSFHSGQALRHEDLGHALH